MMAVDAEAQFHVLAVDDSLIDRKIIERLLKTSSYQVTAVDSGSKALEVLGLKREDRSQSSGQNEIDVNLVITDYCMPGMTGYDLLMKIKESSSLKDIPVVIMSSENVPSRINRCLEGGAEEFLLKPVKLADMKRLVPLMLKGISKEQKQPEQDTQQRQQPEPDENNDTISSSTSSESNNNSIHNNGISNISQNNKRKEMDERFSHDRTKPRFSTTSSCMNGAKSRKLADLPR